VDEPPGAEGATAKSDLQKIIEDARKQQEEKMAAQKAEEEKRRTEVEREEKEAAEAKAKERAERKSQRETQRHQRRISEPETSGITKTGQSKLEKELSVQVTSSQKGISDQSLQNMFPI
jgi:colicin import membrane protein